MMSQVLNWKVALVLSLIYAAIMMVEATKSASRSPQNTRTVYPIMKQMGVTAGQ